MEKENLGKTRTGISANVAASLSYAVTIVTGLLFYFVEKNNAFVRFHAAQSFVVFGFILFLNRVLEWIPVPWLVKFPWVGIVGLVFWVTLMVQAYRGKRTRVPVVGWIAERLAKI